jgi:hypothetical protein
VVVRIGETSVISADGKTVAAAVTEAQLLAPPVPPGVASSGISASGGSHAPNLTGSLSAGIEWAGPDSGAADVNVGF